MRQSIAFLLLSVALIISSKPSAATVVSRGDAVHAHQVPPTPALNATVKQQQLEKVNNMTRLLDRILDNYDKKLRPRSASGPTEIQISMAVMSIGPVSENDETFTIDAYFRQLWIDTRLAFESDQYKDLSLGMSMLDKIWKPDSYFLNGQDAFLHELTTPNRLVRLSRDGSILYSSRLTIRSHCKMNLMYFPMDVQNCVVKIGSFGYRMNEVAYSWVPPTIANTDMAQFELRNHSIDQGVVDRGHGPFSVLELNFLLERHLGFYMMNFYFPSTLILSLSWISFWLPREATADRLGLGVTTVLTMTFYSMEARADLPKIGYPTALDVYLLLCFALLFLCIIECTIVHVNTKYGTGDQELRAYEQKRIELLRRRQLLPYQFQRRLTESMRSYENLTLGESGLDKLQWWWTRKYMGWKGQSKKHDPTNTSVGPNRQPNDSRLRKFQINSISNLDRVSRVVFPLIYTSCMYAYWKLYISLHDLESGDAS